MVRIPSKLLVIIVIVRITLERYVVEEIDLNIFTEIVN